jgi:hypothetical protein
LIVVNKNQIIMDGPKAEVIAALSGKSQGGASQQGGQPQQQAQQAQVTQAQPKEEKS